MTSPFGETIDNVLADLASNDPARPVAQAAARAIGRLRAGNAAVKVAQKATEGSATSREALITIRDEAPNLPSGVEQGLRTRTFALLSLRQFFQRGLLARYLGAAFGFGLGFAIIQFFQYGERELLFAQAVGNSIASGALYGALAGLAVLFASELAARLRAWSRIGRIVLALIVGSLFSALLFVVLRQYYYFNPEPVDNVPWLIGPIIVFVAGFAIVSGLTRNVLLRMLGGGLGAFLAVYGSHLAYESRPNVRPDHLLQHDGRRQPAAGPEPDPGRAAGRADLFAGCSAPLAGKRTGCVVERPIADGQFVPDVFWCRDKACLVRVCRVWLSPLGAIHGRRRHRPYKVYASLETVMTCCNRLYLTTP